MVRNAIINGLINIARRIGRWVLQRLLKLAGVKLIGYMEGKVIDFNRRLAAAKTDRRRTWLSGRIKRWMSAIGWLTRHMQELSTRVVSEVEALARHKKIPTVSPLERLAA